MNVDISLGPWFAVIAGNAAVAAALALRLRRRPVASAVVVGWLLLDVALGIAGVFEATSDRWFPAIAVGLLMPVAIGAWLLVRPGPVRSLVEGIPLAWLIGVQLYRVVGVVFLIGWAQGDLPAAFALPAGLGDIAVGLAAPLVAWRVARRPDRSRGLALLWNAAGLADLVVAVTMGVLTSPGPLQVLSLDDANLAITRLPFVLVPLFAVPISILLHVAVFQRMHGPVLTEAPRGSDSTSRNSVLFRA